MITIDTSVFIDALFIYDESRYEKAKKFFRTVQNLGMLVVVPEIFKIELIGQLVRRMNEKQALKLYEKIVSKVKVESFERLKDIAFSIAWTTGCRATDSFFIATAKLANSILITNDKIMAMNAKKAEIEAYYLIEEFEKVLEKIKELK